MNNKFINKVTSFQGVLCNFAAIASVFILDKVSWWDALFGIFAGLVLILVKNTDALDSLERIITRSPKGKDTPQQNK